MSWLYTASLLPLNEPVTIVDDQGQPFTHVYDEDTFGCQRMSANNIALCLAHDREKPLGKVEQLLVHDGWWRCTFMLDDEVGAEVKPGQAVSAGLGVLRSTGNPILKEVSLVKSGRVDGAVITHRDRLKPITPRPRPSTPAPKATAPVIRRSVAPRITPRDEDEEFRRRLDFYGDDVPFELILENMKAEIQALKGHRW